MPIIHSNHELIPCPRVLPSPEPGLRCQCHAPHLTPSASALGGSLIPRLLSQSFCSARGGQRPLQATMNVSDVCLSRLRPLPEWANKARRWRRNPTGKTCCLSPAVCGDEFGAVTTHPMFFFCFLFLLRMYVYVWQFTLDARK